MKLEVLGVKASELKGDKKDKNCPFHGSLNVKKETFTGVVVKKDTHGTATIEWNKTISVPKYERDEIRRSRIRVHNPMCCLSAEVGQKVLVARTRPISKAKHHVIIKIIGDAKSAFLQEEETPKKLKKRSKKTKIEAEVKEIEKEEASNEGKEE